MRKRVFLGLMLVTALIAFSFTTQSDRYFEIAKNLDIFATLFREVNALYVDDVNPNKLVKTGIDGMLESLDPYTNYIPEDMVEDFKRMNTLQYDGIGATLSRLNNRTVVTMIFENYPAQKGGLKIGDEILKIDNTEVGKLTIDQEDQLLKGQVGTSVNLTIKRLGVEQPLKLNFKREKIKGSNVPYSGMLENNIGYIQLLEFTMDAGKEVKNALIALKKNGARAVILDVRGNPGGLLTEAVNICNIFIPRGKLVVSTKGKIPEQNHNYETLDDAVDSEIPMAVIINRGSASASEIVAGTLQDYDRAIVIGEKSYGKGLVQVSRLLSYNAQLKVTTAKYYTPTGRCIQVLDYSHRRNDGSVGTIPDSAKRPFKTTSGRTVYDGGGIEPDVKMPYIELHTVTQKLYETGSIFEYATVYALAHPSLPDPKSFTLSNDEYSQFTMWMKTRNFTYTSNFDQQLQLVSQEAKREKYYADVKVHLDLIEGKVEENKKSEMQLYKDEIKQLLEEDIASRYYLEKGSIEVGFKYDQEIKKASEVLLNTAQYKKILNLK